MATTPQVGHDRHRPVDTPLDRLTVFDLDRTLIPGASIAALARRGRRRRPGAW